MILILSVILMCSYLYPVCLVSQVLKNADFKEHLSVVALCSVFKYSPNGKGMDSWNIVSWKKMKIDVL